MDKGAQKEVGKGVQKQVGKPLEHFRIIIKLPLWMHVDKSLKSYEKRLKKWRKWKKREVPRIIEKRDSLAEHVTVSAKSIYNVFLDQIREQDSRLSSDKALLTIMASMSTLLEKHQRQIIELENEVVRLRNQRSATKSVMTRRTNEMSRKIEETLSPIKAAFDEMATEAEVQSSDAKRLWA